MCLRPQLVRLPGTKKYITVPCRKCVECLKAEQNGWMIRMIEEFRNYDKVLFITLTYREDIIPKVFDENGEFRYSGCKKHLQDWLKRYRIREQRAGYDEPWKYFICLEYSPIANNHWRAHYHALIFGKSPCRFWSALQEWRQMYGFFKYDRVDLGSAKIKNTAINVARYVSKYCLKGVFEHPVWEFGDKYHHPEKPFRLVSKGFGESYVDRMAPFHRGDLYNGVFPRYKEIVHLPGVDYPIFSDEFLDHVIRNRKVRLDGFEYKLPRYYQERIYKNKYVTEFCGSHTTLYRTSPLSEQVSAALLEKNLCDLDDKVRGLQAQHPDWTTFEAFREVRRSEVSDLNQRERDAHQALIRFYRKAKL